ncbi:ArsA family ATPase [Acidobacteria bacterium AH-259-G07]|nr:ArsA family ATPase [Acidobacteria bacterium AH-259-G07]
MPPCLAQEIGPQEREIEGTGNLFAVEIDPEALFRQWKQSYSQQIEEVFEALSRRAGIDVRFDREVLANLLDLTPPGLDELMALSQLAESVECGRYDLYVLDTAPTGHSLRFLELPDLVRDWLRTFFEILLKYRNIVRLPTVSRILVEMSQKVKKIHQILTDPKRSEAIPVTIPTVVALQETERLLAALKRTGIAVRTLLVNRVVSPADECSTCTTLARDHQSFLCRYRKILSELEIVPLPWRTGDLRRREALMGLLEFV